MTTSHVPALRRIPAAAESVAEIPALPFPPIPRPGLCAAADAVTGNRDGHVLLVCAPAGTGKSVLIADWAARRAADGSDVAWVTVTPELDDAAALWTVLHARFGVPAGASARPPTAQDTLIATLAARATPTVVVLDDAHLLTTRSRWPVSNISCSTPRRRSPRCCAPASRRRSAGTSSISIPG
ncbi:ATP-binding protein [Nocardia asiatica]|uniref:ATP-binding protein n=1 Tax=Nocardia asiatica TaxID=209252 RepID=UPI003EE0F4A2